jgi:hypothetical protein
MVASSEIGSVERASAVETDFPNAPSADNRVNNQAVINYRGDTLSQRPTVSAFYDVLNIFRGTRVRTPFSQCIDVLFELTGVERPSPSFARWFNEREVFYSRGGLAPHLSTNTDELGPLDWYRLALSFPGFVPQAELNHDIPSLDSLQQEILESISTTEPRDLEQLFRHVLYNFSRPEHSQTTFTALFQSWLMFHILYAPPTPTPLSLDAILQEMIEVVGTIPPEMNHNLTARLEFLIVEFYGCYGEARIDEAPPKTEDPPRRSWVTPPDNISLWSDTASNAEGDDTESYTSDTESNE